MAQSCTQATQHVSGSSAVMPGEQKNKLSDHQCRTDRSFGKKTLEATLDSPPLKET